MKHAVIVSISSDIGLALAHHWLDLGWTVSGTYRTNSAKLEVLSKREHVDLVQCDLLDESLDSFVENKLARQWDTLILGAGDLEPVGLFHEVSFDAWERAFQINCLQQLRIVRSLLPFRNKSGTPCVEFFAGGGTNNAPKNYSSYILSKIALIKMTELLAAELPDTRFVIVGPGIVDTKIHAPTLERGKERAPENYEKLVSRLERGACTPMQAVIDVCHYLSETSCAAVSGKNFSVVDDFDDLEMLEQLLETTPDMFTLRRNHNAWRSLCTK